MLSSGRRRTFGEPALPVDEGVETTTHQTGAAPTVGLREHKRAGRWGVPGGVVKQFGLRPEGVRTTPVEPAPPAETPGTDGDGSEYEEAPHRAEDDQTAGKAEEKRDEATPITIELKSH